MFGLGLETAAAKSDLAAALRKEAEYMHDLADIHFKTHNEMHLFFTRTMAESYERLAEHLVPQERPKGRI